MTSRVASWGDQKYKYPIVPGYTGKPLRYLYMDIMEVKQTAADGREDTHVCTYVEIKGFKRFGQLAETSCAMRCKTDKIIMSNNLYHP